MMVRPEEISARSAPSTRPLKHCDTKLAQLITLSPESERIALAMWWGRPARSARLPRTRARCTWPQPSGIVAEFAAEGVGLLHQRLAWGDVEDLPVIFLTFHFLR